MSDAWLTGIRADPGRRRIAVIAAGAVGVALASVHWLGLVAAGALVGVFAPSPRRGLVWGFGLGVVVLGVFFSQAVVAGTLDRVLTAGRPALLAIIIPVVVTPLGSLIRALETD